MHVHRPPVDLGVADLYAAQAAKKAAEAKQAAEVRRKLLRASASIDTAEFVSFAIGERSGGGSQQDAKQDSDESSGRSFTRRGDATEPPAEPLSLWA